MKHIIMYCLFLLAFNLLNAQDPKSSLSFKEEKTYKTASGFHLNAAAKEGDRWLIGGYLTEKGKNKPIIFYTNSTLETGDIFAEEFGEEGNITHLLSLQKGEVLVSGYNQKGAFVEKLGINGKKIWTFSAPKTDSTAVLNRFIVSKDRVIASGTKKGMAWIVWIDLIKGTFIREATTGREGAKNNLFSISEDPLTGNIAACGVSDADMLFALFNNQGKLVWQTLSGTPGSAIDIAYDIHFADSGQWVIAGQSDPMNIKDRDGFACLITDTKKFLWNETYGSETQKEVFYAAFPLQNKGFVLMGTENEKVFCKEYHQRFTNGYSASDSVSIKITHKPVFLQEGSSIYALYQSADTCLYINTFEEKIPVETAAVHAAFHVQYRLPESDSFQQIPLKVNKSGIYETDTITWKKGQQFRIHTDTLQMQYLYVCTIDPAKKVLFHYKTESTAKMKNPTWIPGLNNVLSADSIGIEYLVIIVSPKEIPSLEQKMIALAENPDAILLQSTLYITPENRKKQHYSPSKLAGITSDETPLYWIATFHIRE